LDNVEEYNSIDGFNLALYDHVKNHSNLNVSKLNLGLFLGQGTLELFDGKLAPVWIHFRG
jgi:hypothetical protein